MKLTQFQSLILLGCYGVYSIVLPSPLDIGELIISSVFSQLYPLCPTELCKTQTDTITSYYNLFTILTVPSGFGGAYWVHKKNN